MIEYFIVFALAVLISLSVMHILWGYNLTEADIKEGTILLLCVNAGWFIDECQNIYGGINTPYGDRIK